LKVLEGLAGILLSSTRVWSVPRPTERRSRSGGPAPPQEFIEVGGGARSAPR